MIFGGTCVIRVVCIRRNANKCWHILCMDITGLKKG